MVFLRDTKHPIHPIESKSIYLKLNKKIFFLRDTKTPYTPYRDQKYIQVKRKKNSSFDVGPTSFMARMTA